MEKYNDLSLVHENRLPQRAYYIPHPTLDSALNGKKRNSAAYGCLNGQWKFAYYECPQDLPDNMADVNYDATLPVPSCWECYGYGQYQYTNKNYPFQYDPPYTEALNPVGVYSREFTVSGTGGMFSHPDKVVFLDGKGLDHNREMTAYRDTMREYMDLQPKIWKEVTPEALRAGHGGMDTLMLRSFFDAVREGRPMPIDVYDAASWMVITALSEISIAQGGQSMEIPDFTQGGWKQRQPEDVTDLG